MFDCKVCGREYGIITQEGTTYCMDCGVMYNGDLLLEKERRERMRIADEQLMADSNEPEEEPHQKRFPSGV